nr:DDE-type integrase/transposase/recombinase [Thiomicrorhabdus cannonii]
MKSKFTLLPKRQGSCPLETGVQIIWNNVLFELEEIAPKRFRLQSIHSESYEKSEEEVLSFIIEGSAYIYSTPHKLQKPEPSNIIDFEPIQLSEKQQQKMQKALRYINEMEVYPILKMEPRFLERHIQEMAKKYKDDSPPSPSTLYRWIKKYQNARNTPQNMFVRMMTLDNRGNHTRRYEDEVYEIIDEVVDKLYLQPRGATIRQTYEAVISRIKQMNTDGNSEVPLRLPSYQMVYRFIKAIDPFIVTERREGRNKAKNLFAHTSKSYQPEHPLHWVEIDSTQLDIYVIVELGGQQDVRRPYLTACIDAYSRAIAGVYLSTESPSSESSSECMLQVLSPKAKFLEELGIHNVDWPVYGVPQKVVMDNGTDYWSSEMVNGLSNLNIEMSVSRPRSPTDKPYIERFFRTLTDSFLKGKPGFVPKPKDKDPRYNPQKDAKQTFDEFYRELVLFIAETYNNRKHKSLQCSPLQRWHQGVSQRKVSVISDIEKFPPIFSKVEKRKLTKGGIEMKKIRYNHGGEDYKNFKRAYMDQEVEVAWKKSDISCIWVIDRKTKGYIPVMANDQSIRDLRPSYSAHKKVIEDMREQFKSINISEIAGRYQAIETLSKDESLVPKHSTTKQKIHAVQSQARDKKTLVAGLSDDEIAEILRNSDEAN